MFCNAAYATNIVTAKSAYTSQGFSGFADFNCRRCVWCGWLTTCLLMLVELSETEFSTTVGVYVCHWEWIMLQLAWRFFGILPFYFLFYLNLKNNLKLEKVICIALLSTSNLDILWWNVASCIYLYGKIITKICKTVYIPHTMWRKFPQNIIHFWMSHFSCDNIKSLHSIHVRHETHATPSFVCPYDWNDTQGEMFSNTKKYFSGMVQLNMFSADDKKILYMTCHWQSIFPGVKCDENMLFWLQQHSNELFCPFAYCVIDMVSGLKCNKISYNSYISQQSSQGSQPS